MVRVHGVHSASSPRQRDGQEDGCTVNNKTLAQRKLYDLKENNTNEYVTFEIKIMIIK